MAELGETTGHGPEPTAANTGAADDASPAAPRPPYPRSVTLASDPRRRVPRTDAVLAEPQIALAVDRGWAARWSRTAVGGAQERVRRGEIAPEAVVDAVLDRLPATATSLRPVLNATGVLLHTNLGRAPLSPAARRRARRRRRDLRRRARPGHRCARRRAAGARSTRCSPPSPPRAPRTWSTTARPRSPSSPRRWPRGREIVIARGELVEIGDGFRIPDLLTATGARLREVGTTNRVDARRLRRRHRPGHRVRAQGAPLELRGHRLHPRRRRRRACRADELTALGVPVVADIGSGLLAPHPLLPDEPDATTALTPRRHPRDRVAATSCSAARRPGCCSAPPAPVPSWSRACAGTRSPARCASTS